MKYLDVVYYLNVELIRLVLLDSISVWFSFFKFNILDFDFQVYFFILGDFFKVSEFLIFE